MRFDDTPPVRFRDRKHAGRLLGERLSGDESTEDCIVLGLPRGGLPVAAEVAAALDSSLDILNVRKVGAPFNPEVAIGAIATGGVVVRNEHLIASLGIDEDDFRELCVRQEAELDRRERLYRHGRPAPQLRGRSVILVDDGAATGATMEAAVLAVRQMQAARIIVALPTCAPDAHAMLRRHADRVIALSTPDPYFAVGTWYEDFHQLDDADVTATLEASGRQPDADALRDSTE